MKLRPYQKQASEATHKGWEKHQSVLVVSPTGTGKTEMFINEIRIAREKGERVLILVDRITLVSQTVKRIHQRLGFWPDIEQGDMYASTSGIFASEVIVATIQSLRSGRGEKRYERFNPKDFGLILIDEAHLTITASTVKTVKHFLDGNTDIRMCGYTATPKRGDNKSLRQLYDECVYRYEVIDAIKDGWLVPVVGMVARIDSLELKNQSGKRDWSNDELGELMENSGPLFQVVGTLLEETGRTLVFSPRVAHAEMVCAQLNNSKPGSARVIHAKTPEQERKQILRAFEADEFQYLCNCAVLTTGFDSPGVEVVAMARPTKSWSLFCQCVGRGLRPLAGIVDNFDTAEERRQAILDSDKPYVKVISFVGKNGSANLIGPQHVLAGSMVPPEVTEIANELADEEEGEIDTLELLERAEDEHEERERYKKEHAPVQIDIGYGMQRIDLFNKREFEIATSTKVSIPAEAQCAYLVAAGFEPKKVGAWSESKADSVIKIVQDRHDNGLCTVKQAKLLAKWGFEKQEIARMTKKRAKSVIGGRFGSFAKKKARK